MTITEAISRFLDHVRASQSAGTARTYAIGLRRFTAYLISRSIQPDESEVAALTIPIATGFITWLYEYLLDSTANGDPQKISEATKSTYFAAVSRFFAYLVIEAQLLPLTIDEYDTLRKALARAARWKSRDELSPDKLPTREIVEELLAEARKPLELPDKITPAERNRQHLTRLRNIAMIEALLSSGMRVSELVRLKRGHLLHEIHGAMVKYTKGKKEREVLFSDSSWETIQSYLRERQDGARQRALADLPVFARHSRNAGTKVLPLSTRRVQDIFFELAARAAILEKFHLTPHTLRHFFATEFLSETGNLALTQYALGHSSPNTTRIYAQTKREDYRQAHKKVFDS